MNRILLIITCLLPQLAQAHESSTVELTLDFAARQFSVETDLVDTEFVLEVPRGDNAALTVSDLQNASHTIHGYVRRNVDIRGCALNVDDRKLGVRPGSRPRIKLDFALVCPESPTRLEISSTMFNDLPGYRTALNVLSGSQSRLYIMDGDSIVVEIDTQSVWSGLSTFVVEGVRHILGGLDHLLFLLLLALPMLQRPTMRSCFVAVAGVVTAFTVAHSITLTLSTLGYMSLSPRPVEIMIAASVVVVAVLNVLGKGGKLAWPLAYVFGLVHGFGFAGAFAELASGGTVRWTDLLAFNIGVEAGQLAVIATVILCLSVAARSQKLNRILIPAGSLAAGLVGIAWIIERA